MASWPQMLEQHKITCLWCDVFGNAPDRFPGMESVSIKHCTEYLLVGTLYHSSTHTMVCGSLQGLTFSFYPVFPTSTRLPSSQRPIPSDYFSRDEQKQLHNPTRGFRIDLAVGAGTSAAEPGPCMTQKYYVSQWVSRMGCHESAIWP